MSLLLEAPDETIDGKVWNAGYDNLKVPRDRRDGAREGRAASVSIVVTPTDDHRSYHVSSEKIRREIGYFAPTQASRMRSWASTRPSSRARCRTR